MSTACRQLLSNGFQTPRSGSGFPRLSRFLISFSSLGPAHTQADCRLPGNPSETNTATRFRLIVSSRPNLLLHGALSGFGRVRFCKMPAYGEDGDKGHVR